MSVSRTTPWERIAHVVYIFALAPSPMYSVVPSLRDKADDVEEKKEQPKGLISSIRKLSLGSRSSASSDKGKGKKKVPERQDDWIEPTFPKLSSPFIAEYHKEIIVVASICEPGQVSELDFGKRVKVVGLGDLEIYATSDMCIMGSAFYNCFRFSNLNPLGTIHCYRVTLNQRLISADQTEVWVDRFKLFELGRNIQWDNRVPPTEYIWRGAAVQAKDHAQNPKAKLRPSDGIHFTYAPRLPSSVIGGRPTWFGFDPTLSTCDSVLEFQYWWSIYGEDVNGKPLDPPTEGDMRISTVKHKLDISTCCFSWQNVIVPTYGVRPVAQTDIAGCMEPFARGTEPSSVCVKSESWVEVGGVRHRKEHNYDSKVTSLLQHQFDTEGTCACFYPEAWDTSRPDPAKAEVINGELDLMALKPTPSTSEEMDERRKQREENWWRANRKKRRAVPGFMHMLSHQCACERRGTELAPEHAKAEAEVNAG